MQAPSALKLSLMGLAAASIEWYDFFLYATAAALVFPQVFFSPQLPPLVAQIASFSSFTVGFLARPLGAVLLGHLGDRVGRKAALTAALTTMGVASTLIGLLPSYATAGVFSSVALALLRFMQGLAVGGQWGGAVLLAVESAPAARRGLYGSIAQAGVPVGVLLANLAFFIANRLCTPAAFFAYGWRVLFLLSLVLIALALYLHLRVEDTAAFLQHQRAQAAGPAPASAGTPAAASRAGTRGGSSPVLDALRRYPRSILLGAGVHLSTNLWFYILITYVVAYGSSAAGLALPRGTMLGAVLLANLASVPLLTFAGSWSDQHGRRRIYTLGLVLAFAWAFALFPLIQTRSFAWIALALLGGLSINCLTYGPLAALLAELFDTGVRYSAVSLAYQIAAIAGGGFAPIIATALYAHFHTNLAIAVYIALACVLSLLCLRLLGSELQSGQAGGAERAVA